jgi:5-methylcytosine-specific restriction endonuclease McrA
MFADEKIDIVKIIKQSEDYLFPKLKMSIRERSLYYYMLRHTRLLGKESSLFAIYPMSQALGIAESSVRESIRAMHNKGCIHINRSRKGHLVKVLLPNEIKDIIQEELKAPTVDIESIDFFTDRIHLVAILNREGNRCFYCFKEIVDSNCELEHVVPVVQNGNNSYRNVVASCHECNTTKQDTSADDFCRLLYKKGILSQKELENRLEAIQMLQSGHLKPYI